MKVLIGGAGLVGSFVAGTFVKKMPHISISIADRDGSRKRVVEALSGGGGLDFIHCDLLEDPGIAGGYDQVVSCLPSSCGFPFLETCAAKGKRVVDLSFSAGDPFELADLCAETGALIVPDMGFAPGISNVILGMEFRKGKGVERVRIMAGGLPLNIDSPLSYRVTWSADDLLEEYLRRARVVRDGRVVSLEPLSGVEGCRVEGVGELESFLTDGLRTLLHTIKPIKEMEERTLRYPGHVERMRFIMDLGLLDRGGVEVNGREVVPIRFLASLLKERWMMDEKGDLSILVVEMEGEGFSKRFTLIDRFDPASGTLSMAKMTGLPAFVVARAIIEERLEGRGVIPPELLPEEIQMEIIEEIRASGAKMEGTGV